MSGEFRRTRKETPDLPSKNDHRRASVADGLNVLPGNFRRARFAFGTHGSEGWDSRRVIGLDGFIVFEVITPDLDMIFQCLSLFDRSPGILEGSKALIDGEGGGAVVPAPGIVASPVNTTAVALSPKLGRQAQSK